MSVVRTGETEYDREMEKWNKPYVFVPFPAMLYRGHLQSNGTTEVHERIVQSESDQLLAMGEGWTTSPVTAKARVEARENEISQAAAEAAAAAVKMSGKAQRERAVRDADTHRQLTD
tara:strand:+ start:191 stop:541 length:351 start_codon:yes stop_codon:yes gene_type:complete